MKKLSFAFIVAFTALFLVSCGEEKLPEWDGLYFKSSNGNYIEIGPRYGRDYPVDHELYMLSHGNWFSTYCVYRTDSNPKGKASFFKVKKSDFDSFYLKGSYDFKNLTLHKPRFTDRTCVRSEVGFDLQIKKQSDDVNKHVTFMFENEIPSGEVIIWIGKHFWFVDFY